MDNLQILSSNLEKLEDANRSISNYYKYASKHFFTGFNENGLTEFKALKSYLDKIEIEITNCSNEIIGYIISDQRMEKGLELLMNDRRYSHLNELSNCANLRRISIRTESLSTTNSELKDLVILWANNPIEKSRIINRYNNALLVFRALQTEQYEILGSLSKALYLFFNYESTSKLLKQHIIDLDLRPLKY